MDCHLLVPHLFQPDMARAASAQGAAAPALQMLLARAGCLNGPGEGAEAWLCRAFGVERQQDWPIAPLSLSADGGDPGRYYWLRADPVHLQAQRAQVILADSSTFTLTREEAEQLTEALNCHFRDDGLAFFALHPGRWYLRLEAAPALQTVPLSEATGRNINELLPAGQDSMRWHRLVNEIQMLMHGHSLNDQRESRGQLPVNSLWIWGGGTRPAVPGRPFSQVWAHDPVALALARESGTVHAALPATAEGLAWRPGEGAVLAVLDGLRGAGQYGDAYGWLECLATMETTWFAPVMDGLRRGLFRAVHLHGPGERRTVSCSLSRADLRKFWRRPKSLPATLARFV